MQPVAAALLLTAATGLNMARKKNRQLNIAHKRAKRKQDGKSRQRQIAHRKQRMLESAKSDEEQLQDRIMKSGMLVDELELENLRFDTHLLHQEIQQLLNPVSPIAVENEDHVELPQDADRLELIAQKFRNEVLPCLITHNFLKNMSQSLKACETRLKRIGAREKAEIAFVTRLFFDLAEPASLNLHPLILNICVRTVDAVLTQSELLEAESQVLQCVLTDLLAFGEGEEIPDREIHAIHEQVSDSADVDCHKPSDITDHVVNGKVGGNKPFTPTLEELPAKALYKNLDWAKVRQTIEMGDGYRLVADAEQQVEFSHTTQHRYITLTADRLLLQCPRKPQLEDAMQEIEHLCGESVFYLAKSIDE